MYFFTWAPTATAKFQINIFLYACYKTKRPGFGYNTAPIVRRWPELETRRQSGGRQDCEKKNPPPRTEKGAAEWCHGSGERPAPCYLLSSAWKSTVSDFFPFRFFFSSFPFQRALESSSEVSRRWECTVRPTGDPKWAVLDEAAPTFTIQKHRSGELRGPKAQRPRAPAKRL